MKRYRTDCSVLYLISLTWNLTLPNRKNKKDHTPDNKGVSLVKLLAFVFSVTIIVVAFNTMPLLLAAIVSIATCSLLNDFYAVLK